MTRAIVAAALVLAACAGQDPTTTCVPDRMRCTGSTLERCVPNAAKKTTDDPANVWTPDADCALTSQTCWDCAVLGPGYGGAAACGAPAGGLICQKSP